MSMYPTLRRSWPLEQLRDIDRAFNRLRPLWPENENEGNLAAYPTDVREEDDKFVVEAEMPGFTRDQIEVTLDQGVLTINATRQPQEPKGHEHVSERRYTRISRSFRLGTVADENKVEAKLDNGVLTLTVPKKEEVRPRKIEVT